MTARFAGSLLLASWFLPASGSAQSAAERLEKGIYAQETAGDLDGAIQIYREIVASSPGQRVYAAQAQFRLAQALLQKGDLSGAASEFQVLAANYAEFTDLITSMARRLHGNAHGPSISLGTLSLFRGTPQKSHYRHNQTGVEFALPEGWSFQGDTDSSGGGQMVMFSDARSRASAFAWIKPYDGAGVDLASELRNDLAVKPEQRKEFEGWKVRPESVQTRIIANEQALSAVADYVENGRTMVEYLTWIRSTRSRLLFSARLAASEFPAFQARFDQVMATVRIP